MSDYYTNVETTILRTVRSVMHGLVTVFVQDGKMVQMEKLEKARFNPDGSLMVQGVPQAGLTGEKRISSAFTNLQYGQVVFVIRDGGIIQIEKTEKKRLLNHQGMYGEGI